MCILALTIDVCMCATCTKGNVSLTICVAAVFVGVSVKMSRFFTLLCLIDMTRYCLSTWQSLYVYLKTKTIEGYKDYL